MIEPYNYDSDIFDDEVDHPVSVYSLKAHFKDDIRMRMQDKQLSELDVQDLNQKMNQLTLNKCNFKTDIRRHRKLAQKQQECLNIQKQTQNDSNQLQATLKQRQQAIQLSCTDQMTLMDTVPKINFIREMKDSINQDATLDLRIDLKTQSQSTFDIRKLRNGLSPSPINRLSTKNQSKLSQRSPEHDSNLDLSFNYTMQVASQGSIQYQDNKFEQQQSKKSTINQKHNHQRIKLKTQQHVHSQRSSQLSLLQIDQEGFRGRSLSSVSTPKSILKNPSYQNSVLDIVNKIKFQGRPCFSSLNLIDSTPKKLQQNIYSSAKRVKFCLTKQQARRENIYN
ncbi:unnamed protein product [Paramecium pentaurelia]|uniref:Uncharacterized protein n=1 Tax=Paramecium pentaurelia TaxID=43138 RepID=A0A8S1XLD1_9CILI|nr:unnamed protein product [Paramecium pentaurelia]